MKAAPRWWRVMVESVVALWRITHDAAVDDHANYHQQQCWNRAARCGW